jgi:two-component system, NarL family, invasion response regulator UvrY
MPLSSKILIGVSEEQTLMRSGLIQILKYYEEFDVRIEVGNATELIAEIKKGSLIPDICVFAINDKLVFNIETIKEFKKDFPIAKILVLSIFKAEFPIQQLIQTGINGYLLKTVSPSELRTALNEIYLNDFHYSDVVTPVIRSVIQNSRKPEVNNFTDRESQFIYWSTSELTYQEIAAKMHLSRKTIENYRDALYAKLQIKSRTGLVAYAFRNGIV